MATEEYPCPRPAAFQSSGGPLSGHCGSKPVSGEKLSRLGPCHCGHSSCDAAFSGGAAQDQAPTAKTRIANSITVLRIESILAGENTKNAGFPCRRDCSGSGETRQG